MSCGVSGEGIKGPTYTIPKIFVLIIVAYHTAPKEISLKELKG